MSKLNSVSELSSSASKPTEESATPATDKPLDKRHHPTEEEWLQAVQDGSKRMSQDESFRLKIAQRLS